jgi:predicted ribonuclease YlaK
VIDTNSFIDAFDTILSFLEDPYLTVLVPLPVISELKGLRNKKAASPTAQDEDHAKEVSKAAVRSLQILETIKKDNIKLLARKGRMLKMDINYQDISYEAKVVRVEIV